MPDHKVLVVEDDEELGAIFLELLQYAGYDVTRVKDGQAALDFLSQQKPDAVVLDMHLPKVSGQEVLKHIRRDRNLANLKVLVVTADTKSAETVESQADAVAMKPLGTEKFLNLVKSITST